MRIGLVHVSQETNDFNPVPTTLEDYAAFGLHDGAAMVEAAGDWGEIAGHFDAVAASGRTVETVPILKATAVAGGRLDRAAFAYFQERIAAGLRAAGPLDGLALQLHGACAAEGVDDVEGAQAALARQVLGPDVPILLCLDHHANVTRAMLDAATAVVAHRTQPHLPRETGRLATALLIRILSDGIRPAMAARKIPMISHQEQFLTDRGPMKRWFDRARAMEADPRVLAASPFPMQPWLDVAEGGWTAVVVTDGDAGLAAALADELAELAWSLRADFQRREAMPVDEAVVASEAAPEGMVLLSDTGDTVFGGAAGDSPVILEAMLRLGIRSPALVPMVSPATVSRLAAAGEGARLTLVVGGDLAPGFFRPLEVTGWVRRIGGGPVRLDLEGRGSVDMGRVAVFEVGPATLLVTERRGVGGNLPGVYTAFGVDPGKHKIAVLKTASNFQYFAPLASRTIRVDTPGPGQSDLSSLPWRRMPRPVYPLDKEAVLEPSAHCAASESQ